MQPGDTITPGGEQPESAGPDVRQDDAKVSKSSEQAPAPLPEPQDVQDEQPRPEQPAPAESSWQYRDDENTAPGPFARHTAAPVSWTASEYVAHDKNAGWYVLVVLAALGLGGLIYLFTREWVSPVVVVLLGIAFAAFGARKPQVLEYAIDDAGVRIGQKLYPYGLFRTFSVIEEGAVRSILLMPLQRFNLPINVYYDPADEEKIIDALSFHLPHEDRQLSAIDNLMRKIRF